MDKQFQELLRKVGFKVIEEEGLPKPKEIYFRFSVGGTVKRSAVCQHIRYDDTYRIIVNTVKGRYVKNDNGKYTGKNGQRYNRAIGTDLSNDELKKHLAHEIAHLKFWNHGAEHKSYTNYILDKFNQKIEEFMNNIVNQITSQ